MNERNTKQKEIIFTCILNDKSHPTINDIVSSVRKMDPTIGQATVYRNVSKLVEDGKICKLFGSFQGIRYDGDTLEHDHLVCVRCGIITDLYGNSYEDNKKAIYEDYSFLVNRVSTTYEGVCLNCQNKLEKR